jgi:hypothetical protein
VLHLLRVLQEAPPDVAGQLVWLASAVFGFLTTLVTNLGKRLAVALLGTDSKIVMLYKGAQPMIAGIVAILFALLAPKIPGIELPQAAMLVGAPLSTLVWIALRELREKFYPPAVK